jgi:hypothetical protein
VDSSLTSNGTVLRITEGSVEWLRQRLPGPVHDLDLETTYSFVHPLNASRHLERQELRAEREILWRVLFHEPGGECLFDPEHPALARKILALAPLYGGAQRAQGPVAYNAAFFLKQKFCRQGFARAVYAHEVDLYRRWGMPNLMLYKVLAC